MYFLYSCSSFPVIVNLNTTSLIIASTISAGFKIRSPKDVNKNSSYFRQRRNKKALSTGYPDQGTSHSFTLFFFFKAQSMLTTQYQLFLSQLWALNHSAGCAERNSFFHRFGRHFFSLSQSTKGNDQFFCWVTFCILIYFEMEFRKKSV